LQAESYGICLFVDAFKRENKRYEMQLLGGNQVVWTGQPGGKVPQKHRYLFLLSYEYFLKLYFVLK
jgi:hypothetical protein